VERTGFGIPELDVDGGYLPGGDESGDLAESLWEPQNRGPQDPNPEKASERLDESIFAAMLHP
jgi:hypothetical protein